MAFLSHIVSSVLTCLMGIAVAIVPPCAVCSPVTESEAADVEEVEVFRVESQGRIRVRNCRQMWKLPRRHGGALYPECTGQRLDFCADLRGEHSARNGFGGPLVF